MDRSHAVSNSSQTVSHRIGIRLTYQPTAVCSTHVVSVSFTHIQRGPPTVCRSTFDGRAHHRHAGLRKEARRSDTHINLTAMRRSLALAVETQAKFLITHAVTVDGDWQTILEPCLRPQGRFILFPVTPAPHRLISGPVAVRNDACTPITVLTFVVSQKSVSMNILCCDRPVSVLYPPPPWFVASTRVGPYSSVLGPSIGPSCHP